MAGQRHDEGQDHGQGTTGKALKRRGLIAGAAALVAGIAATQTSQRVGATDTDTNYIAEGGSGIGFRCNSGYAYGATLSGIVYGVEGSTSDGAGVRGISSSIGTGVFGQSQSAYGVWGRSYGTGSFTNAGLLGINDFTPANNNAIGVQGSCTGSTGIAVFGGRKSVPSNAFNGIGVMGLSDGGYGVQGETAGGRGVYGAADTGYGVYGLTSTNTAGIAGVYGTNTASGSNATAVYGVVISGSGVRGDSSGGLGVQGVTANGEGVRGESTSGRAMGALSSTGTGVFANTNGTSSSAYGVNAQGNGGSSVAVRGLNSFGNGGNGVVGETQGKSGAVPVAVYGINRGTGVGTQGVSFGGHGVVGSTLASGFAAVTGFSNGAAGAYAGLFYGSVVVANDLLVLGNKSAAARHVDGGLRQLYCVEAPEAWFEDFGEGKIVNGRADVKLDPEYLGVVDASTLQVFTQPHDESHHLAVNGRSALGFTVGAAAVGDLATRGIGGSGVNGTFSYRVVAKRRDVQGKRLARVTVPAEAKLPTVPAEQPSEPKVSVASPLPVPPPPPASPVVSLPQVPPTATGGAAPPSPAPPSRSVPAATAAPATSAPAPAAVQPTNAPPQVAPPSRP